MTTIGLAMGGNARTGMEDTLMVASHVLADSNARLLVGWSASRSPMQRAATVDGSSSVSAPPSWSTPADPGGRPPAEEQPCHPS